MRPRNGFYVLPLGFFILVLVASGPSLAWAGQLSEEFTRELSQAAPGTTVSGLVSLAEQLDVEELERQMASTGIQTRWRRHEFVVRAARELAARTQPSLLQELDAQRALGQVVSYEPFWISNLVAVDAAPEFFLQLSRRSDVGRIDVNSPVTIRAGWVDEDRSTNAEHGADPRALEDGLIAINVQAAWDLGYTGATRLVCDFDTGADGNHPAFAARWRGSDEGVPASAAWRDPYGGTQFPYDSGAHGTHTLGIMVADPPTSDPLGVAYEAKWIAAGILIGYNVGAIIGCYQWATDPDENPGTIEDVPDVINNSWGTSGNCESTYWNAIDIVEAAGIVNTIAVDNTGPGAASVNSPESRADSPYQNFGIGNVNPHQPGYPINSSSGRGPSPCDFVSLKPEVTAPGTSIRSTLPGGSYGNMTGTSMACPHVSGAATLLRQVDPSLTVDEVKDALMLTAFDRGDAGEDNTYGWGIIDVGAAVQYILNLNPPTPSPTGLTIQATHGGDIRLLWQTPTGIAPTNPLTGYNLYRALDSEPYPAEPYATLPPGDNDYIDPDLGPGTYRYVVTATYDNGGESEPSNEVIYVVAEPTDVAEAGPESGALRLTAEPNPFSPRTQIRYRASGAHPVRLEIYDAAGQRVRTLVDNAAAQAGEHEVAWDGRDDQGHRAPAGAYFIALQEGSVRQAERLVLIR